MSATARSALLTLCAAALFPASQPGLTLDQPAPDLRLPQEEVAPRQTSGAEEIVVHANRAPMQADPHAAPLRFRDVPENLQAIDLWALHPGSPPCCQDPYETDIGGQPGRP